MSERLWRVLISGGGGLLLFLLAAYGLRAAYSWKHEPGRLRGDLAVVLALCFLLAFLAFLARTHHP
ncbi:protein of unknown function [Methylacidimicrobium sp. AP8]|uniref:hypothetical protein n=1 Tax=Methylacidimicrobium sp. AP8 TaxID=2730359 RepID=UPI0018C10F0B|nr:hypothetical protein [Methylacidimicrobium sp. AP8]CAB4243238.1 protein of unknown function [Methylacidimicrobium sp. AP8]